MERPSSPERLIVLETDTAFWVAVADDPDDWLACFLKSPDFPARAWAERMVAMQGLCVDQRAILRPGDRGTHDP
jgi:hypothetical protein